MALSASKLKVGDVHTARLVEDLKRTQIVQYAGSSGDYNPLHTDEAFARSKGFDGVVVYGALLTAKVSQLIGMRLPGRDSVWASMALEFRMPLYVGQAAQVEGTVAEVSESTGLVVLKIAVRAACNFSNDTAYPSPKTPSALSTLPQGEG